jgi:hypothetical protein
MLKLPCKMDKFINKYFSDGQNTELVAMQIATNDPWDQTAATYHRLPRTMAGMFAQFLSNSANTQIRMTFPKHEHEDLGRCNGSYFSPDKGKIHISSATI